MARIVVIVGMLVIALTAVMGLLQLPIDTGVSDLAANKTSDSFNESAWENVSFSNSYNETTREMTVSITSGGPVSAEDVIIEVVDGESTEEYNWRTYAVHPGSLLDGLDSGDKARIPASSGSTVRVLYKNENQTIIIEEFN